MENVNNRSLFRRKSQAARDKVRQMGMVREPQGILASFPELMMAAGGAQSYADATATGSIPRRR
jgi:hypothetical protein